MGRNSRNADARRQDLMWQFDPLPRGGQDLTDRLRRDGQSSWVVPKSLKTGILPFETPDPFHLLLLTVV